jgi:hypothetical protein
MVRVKKMRQGGIRKDTIKLVGVKADLPVRQRTQTGIPIHRGKLGGNRIRKAVN